MFPSTPSVISSCLREFFLNMNFSPSPDRLSRVLALAASILLLTASSRADEPGVPFLSWRPDAVSNALGGAGTAAIRNAFSAYHNPANLANAPDLGAGISFVKPLPLFDGVVHSFYSLAWNQPQLGAFAISANYYRKGTHARTASSGPEVLATEDFTDHHWKLSYARRLSAQVAVGLGIGLLNSELSAHGTEQEQASATATALTLDAGALVRGLFPDLTIVPEGEEETTGRGLDLGLSVFNVGSDISYIDDSQTDPLPTRIVFGSSYRPFLSRTIAVLLLADFEAPFNPSFQLATTHLGAEARILRYVALRAGYVLDSTGGRNSYPTWGGGLQLGFASVNVANYDRTYDSVWHFDVSFSMEIYE